MTDTETVVRCCGYLVAAQTLEHLEEAKAAIMDEIPILDDRDIPRRVYQMRLKEIQDADNATRQDRLNVDASGASADRGNREDNQPDSV